MRKGPKQSVDISKPEFECLLHSKSELCLCSVDVTTSVSEQLRFAKGQVSFLRHFVNSKQYIDMIFSVLPH